MSTFEGERTASTLSLPRKVLAVLMSIVLVVGLNPIVKAPEAAYAADMKVADTDLTEGAEGEGEEVVYVASIGDAKYKTLADAVTAAQNGETVALTGEVDLGASTLKVGSGKDFTLDLNGQTIKSTAQTIHNGGKLVIKDGSSSGGGTIVSGDCAIAGLNNSTTTIESGTVKASESAVIAGRNTNVTVNITGGTFEAADNAVVMDNGSAGYDSNTFNISGGKFVGNIKTNGYVACGVYAANNDTWNITGGEFVINGGAGIVARAGVVNLSDDVKITTTANNVTVNSEGKGKVGDSRVVVPCAAIVFDSEANYPGLQQNQNSKVAVKGGSYECAEGVDVVTQVGEGSHIELSGGAYSKKPADAFVAQGYTANQTEDGKFSVVEDTENYRAKIGSTYYKTLAKAVAAATDGDTVTLIGDAELGAVQVSKSIVFDLGGKTLTLTGAFEQTKGKVSLENGTVVDKNVIDAFQQNGTDAELVFGEKLTVRCSNSIIWAHNGGKVTVDGASLESAGENTLAYAEGNGSEFVLESGTVKSPVAVVGIAAGAKGEINGGLIDFTGNTTGVYCNGGSTIVMNDGTVTTEQGSGVGVGVYGSTYNEGHFVMKGGTIISKNADKYAALYSMGPKSTIVLYDGLIESVHEALQVSYGSSATVNGGELRATNAVINGFNNSDTAKTEITAGKIAGSISSYNNEFNITGGSFSVKPADKLVSEGYAAYETGDGEYPYAIGKKMTVTATGYEGSYDGDEHGIKVNVTDPISGATIKYGEREGDYSLGEAPKYDSVGTHTVYYQVTADGYVPVTGSETVKIDKKALTAVDFENIDVQTYTGGQIKPKVSPAESAGLSADDYQVIYAENTNAGANAGYAVITGKGNYSGIVTKRFTIESASLSVDMIDVDESYAYTGSEIAEAKVLFNGVELKNGVDYVASYENNTQPGTATVEVIGLDGNFKGNASKTFKITRSAEQVKVTPAENVPQVSYSAADTTVPRDDAYTVSGTFGDVSYSLGGEPGPVGIDPSGSLTVKAGTKAGEYEVSVNVLATEGESSSLGNATVKVKVVEAPSALKVAASGSTFKTLTYSKTAQTVAEVGKDYTVTGTSGGDLIYAKTLGPDSISVDEETGKITAAAGLPAGSYYVGVLAYDQGVEGKYQAGMGQVNFFVQVKKAASDMTVTAVKTAPSVKYATKAQTIAASKAVTVKGNSGAVTYSATTTSKLTMTNKGVISVPVKTSVNSYKLNVTVTDPGDANHTGTTATVPVTVKVTKAASTLAVTAKGTTKKPVAIKIGKAGAGAAVTNVGQGTLSVQNASKNASAKKLTVKYDSKKKAINVTVPKKGVKKGTYPVIVRVMTKGNSNYSAGDKSITTYIKVS